MSPYLVVVLELVVAGRAVRDVGHVRRVDLRGLYITRTAHSEALIVRGTNLVES
jgi:hypothetical protein